MKILVACEESQEVTIAFRNKGHEAYSCDILPCSGGHPEWHIHKDVRQVLSEKWDMIIAHPPCTYLSRAGIGWYFHPSRYMSTAQRFAELVKAREFFMMFHDHDCEKICIENPQMHRFAEIRLYDQLVEPWHFGGVHRKKTGLWLKGLPPLLKHEGVIKPAPIYTQDNGKNRYFVDMKSGSDKKGRSKTFSEIANAMAEQWG